ncbi:SHOCT domain-containing protein [Thiolapillus brandeum]|uniref:SHOCT domain-containing protein n=1 Tax=Thiolapillus brandeum TaxID=1076588 RepID=A0A7U6GIU2_9GAMM|nr:SHOCT domain-containing protein [Thiolapillus brandeum]BAO44383.1 conserved hypothetical protein [Thiolapillus brandeum]
MWIIWILFIVAVIWVIRAATSDNNSQPPASRDSALEILKTRYARGEINTEEYERMRREIET